MNIKKRFYNFINWIPSKYAYCIFLLMPFLAFLINGFFLDNDFWFLINTGREILKSGFVTIEPFTIHKGFAFLPQQWLSDIIFYSIYHNFGIFGVYILILILNLFLIILINKVCCLFSYRSKRTCLITIFVDLLILVLFFTSRPQVFDCLIFILELYILELYLRERKYKFLFFLPVLSLLLINLHASMWIMFFVFLIPYYVEFIVSKICKKNVYEILPLIIFTVISLLCGLINPYGIKSILYLFNSYGVSEINHLVAEMRSVSIDSFEGKIMFIICIISLYSFYYNKGSNKLRLFLLFLGTLYLGLSHFKGILFFLIVLPFILSYNFRLEIKKDFTVAFLYEKIVYIIIIILFSLCVVFLTKLNKNNDGYEVFSDYLNKNASKSIKLYTNYNLGGYFEYKGYKCYIDPRAELFLKANNKKEDIFKEYYNIDMDNVEKFLKKYDFDYLLVDKKVDYYLYNHLKKDNMYQKVLSNKFLGQELFLYKKLLK